MYYFYMILIRCRLTNVCYLLFLTEIWMMIRLQSDLDSVEAAEDLLDWSVSHWNVLLVRRHVLTLTSTLEWLLVLKQINVWAIFGIVSRERLSILINSWDEVSEVDQNMIWEENPCLKYKHIDEETWRLFKENRENVAWMVSEVT